jgi:hypothetical protein
MADGEARRIALEYAVRLAKHTGTDVGVVENAERYLAFLQGDIAL